MFEDETILESLIQLEGIPYKSYPDSLPTECEIMVPSGVAGCEIVYQVGKLFFQRFQ